MTAAKMMTVEMRFMTFGKRSLQDASLKARRGSLQVKTK
jgi:hypothetical protein